jgi:predicted PurR-regulated permease PerM
MNTKIEFSVKTLLLFFVLVIGGWALYQIRDILYLLFIAFLLMTALHPLVAGLERIKIPRFFSILIIYLACMAIFGFSVITSIPSLITQTTRFAQELPGVVAKVLPYWNADLSVIGQQLAPIGENILKVTIGIFSNIFTIVAVLVFTFYFLLERRRAKDIFTDLFGGVIAGKAIDILRAIELKLGDWVRGELILMLTIGVLVYIGLLILKIEFALPIAIFAGLLEIVPNIGPVVSAVPAVLVGFATSPLLALSVVALFIIVHQLENNLIVPIVMKRSVGLSPLITILALMVGGRLAGILGAVLAVPILLVVQVLVNKLLIGKQDVKDINKPTKNPPK